jgi:hypothetical protein
VQPRHVVLAVAVAVLTAGCGVPTPAAPPTAQEVLAKPQQSNLKDAHFTLSGKVTSSGVTIQLVGDGALIYRPKQAGRVKFQTTVGGQTVTIEEISINGTNYGLTPASSKWVATKGTPSFDPSAFAGASAQKYVGEETLPQGKAWHATATSKDGNAFEAYIRESDGYPIKYIQIQNGGQPITLTFDRYNAGETITAPPTDQVQ